MNRRLTIAFIEKARSPIVIGSGCSLENVYEGEPRLRSAVVVFPTFPLRGAATGIAFILRGALLFAVTAFVLADFVDVAFVDVLATLPPLALLVLDGIEATTARFEVVAELRLADAAVATVRDFLEAPVDFFDAAIAVLQLEDLRARAPVHLAGGDEADDAAFDRDVVRVTVARPELETERAAKP